MTTTAAKLPPGVTRNDLPCWVLVYANGSLYESHDGAPHLHSEESAQGLAAGLADEDDPAAEVPKPVQLPAPCFMVAALCGYLLDEEEWVVHSETAELAAEAGKAYEWRPVAGGLACSDSTCNGCWSAINAYERQHGPMPLPVPVAEGQEPLIGAQQ